MTRPLAEVLVGIGGETSTTVMPLFRRKASNAKIALPPERVNKTIAGLKQAGRADAGVCRCFNQFIERVSFGFIAHDGDECRCIDHHHVGRPLLS